MLPSFPGSFFPLGGVHLDKGDPEPLHLKAMGLTTYSETGHLHRRFLSHHIGPPLVLSVILDYIFI
jgi:hypothetical protein